MPARLAERPAPRRNKLRLLLQECVDFAASRRGRAAAKTLAFHGSGGGRESQRFVHFLPLGQRERKRTMKDIAGSECIDSDHLECR